MPRPKFIDIHPAHNAGGYYATNESPKVHLDLLADRTYKRGLSICSGGEVPLFVLGPRCDSIIAVDHGYISLTSTFLKAIALDKMGLRGFKSLMLERPQTERETVFKGMVPEIPAVLQTVVNTKKVLAAHTEFYWNSLSINPSWVKEIPDDLEAHIPEVLDKLVLVHGDLFDVEVPAEGFDVLYASNAHEHSGRGGWDPKKIPVDAPPNANLQSYTKLVGTGGHCLATGNFYTNTPNDLKGEAGKSWKLVSNSRASNWDHHLLERLPTPAMAA